MLYRACMRAGITMLSIGHRPALRKFHQFIIHFDGAATAKGWRLEEVPPEPAVAAMPAGDTPPAQAQP